MGSAHQDTRRSMREQRQGRTIPIPFPYRMFCQNDPGDVNSSLAHPATAPDNPETNVVFHADTSADKQLCISM